MQIADQPIEYERAVVALMRELPESGRAQVYYFAQFLREQLTTKETDALMLASIESLRKVWDTPEEDEAWAYLQEVTSS